jgi:hypothetical protein
MGIKGMTLKKEWFNLCEDMGMLKRFVWEKNYI